MERPTARWSCAVEHPEGVVLKLKVVPGASRTGAQGLRQDRLRVRVQAPPVEGKANVAVRKWLARTFGVRPGAAAILSGERSSAKEVLLRGLSLNAAHEALDTLDLKEIKGAK